MGLEQLDGVQSVRERNGECNISDFILGIIAGVGCFTAAISENSENKLGVAVRAHFITTMDDKDSDLIEHLHSNLSVGNVYYHNGMCEYKSSSIKDHRVLINSIDAYIAESNTDHPFILTDKYEQYKQWKTVVEMINNGEHLNKYGIVEIAEIIKSMNTAGRGKAARDIDKLLKTVGSAP